jgi:hypothetical protein
MFSRSKLKTPASTVDAEVQNQQGLGFVILHLARILEGSVGILAKLVGFSFLISFVPILNGILPAMIHPWTAKGFMSQPQQVESTESGHNTNSDILGYKVSPLLVAPTFVCLNASTDASTAFDIWGEWQCTGKDAK